MTNTITKPEYLSPAVAELAYTELRELIAYYLELPLDDLQLNALAINLAHTHLASCRDYALEVLARTRHSNATLARERAAAALAAQHLFGNADSELAKQYRRNTATAE